MKEKDFQTKFNIWVKYHIFETTVFELKLTKVKSIRFDAVAEHQSDALYLAKHERHGLVFKIPDCGYTNPFDCFFIRGSKAYVVIMFYERGAKDFVMIDIDVWLNEKSSSIRKSITKSRAYSIGIVHYLRS